MSTFIDNLNRATSTRTETATWLDGSFATAVFSDCDTYRYRLTRTWDTRVAPVTFIMLNPSKATADEDDNTIGRCISFARRISAGGIVVVNLYAYCATDPDDLVAAGYLIGPHNDDFLISALEEAANHGGPVVAAWGFRALADRATRVTDMAHHSGHRLQCLGVTKAGLPRHPLYLKGDTPLSPYPTGA